MNKTDTGHSVNSKIGMAASLVTLAAVLAFAASMLIESINISYLSSLFIAFGFVPMICSFAAVAKPDAKAAGYSAAAFAAVYAVFISLVYFAQLTTVRLSPLSAQGDALLNYRNFGLFFSYDLLGYAFMALSTFFAAFVVPARSRANQWLKALLMIHGVFFIACLLLPMLGFFRPGMSGGTLVGTLVLEFWCAYFTPVCILSFLYFRKV